MYDTTTLCYLLAILFLHFLCPSPLQLRPVVAQLFPVFFGNSFRAASAFTAATNASKSPISSTRSPLYTMSSDKALRTRSSFSSSVSPCAAAAGLTRSPMHSSCVCAGYFFLLRESLDRSRPLLPKGGRWGQQARHCKTEHDPTPTRREDLG